ncbi:hypothetical protein D4764_02G0001760 [Takifugu flavidus]|uniref:Uncharacterized protein n=1 Tax=Takifugu flavidus TaxID=433684 RepID=A0A5C6NJN6_9TELE|nr:hypothetical protein D4764_02G0001760 [Takifugu flavidus]
MSGLRCLKTACDEAKRRCRLVTQNPSEVQWMGQLILTFGKYRGKIFQWLVENDVDYIKYIVDRHVKEKQRPERGPINEEWIKDYLQFFPQVSCHLEMCVDRAIYGQAAAQKAKRPGKQSRPASAHKSVRRTAPSSTARSPSEPHIEDKHGKMKWRKVLKDDRMWFQTYCPNSKMSSSPRLEGQTFDTFADFQRAVDILLGALFQV